MKTPRMKPASSRFCASFAILLAIYPTFPAASQLPPAAIATLTETAKRDFASVIEIRTIELDDEPIGPSAWIVSGWGNMRSGLRVEVFLEERHRVVKKWDSAPYTHGAEFMVEGRPEIQVWGDRQHEYGILIEGCAPHRCGGDISGFLWFSGQTGKAGKAIVMGYGMDQPLVSSETYKVEFSPAVDKDVRLGLQDAICSSAAIMNKSGLPFKCETQ